MAGIPFPPATSAYDACLFSTTVSASAAGRFLIMMWAAGGAAVCSGAVVEHGQFCLKVCSFLDAFHQELHDIFDCFLRHSFGLGVVRAACFVEGVLSLQYVLKVSPRNCGPPSYRMDLGTPKYLNHFLTVRVTAREVVVVWRCTHGYPE